MDRIDCDLALGRHEQLIGELNRLVSGTRSENASAASRCSLSIAPTGRPKPSTPTSTHAETLVDELGIEPSEALQRLQRGILAHDPALGYQPASAPATGRPLSHYRLSSLLSRLARTEPPTTPGQAARFHPRRRHIVLATLLALALAGGLSAFAARPSGHRALPPPVQPNSLVQLDPTTGKVVAVTPVGVEPGPIAFTPTAIWTVNHGDRTVSRYDLRTHRVQTRGGFPHQPYDVVADMAGNVWVSSKTPIVTRLAAGVGGTSAGPLYPSKTATIRVPGAWASATKALGAGYVWAIVGPLTYPAPGLPDREDDRLSLIDMRSDVRCFVDAGFAEARRRSPSGTGQPGLERYDAGGSWLAIMSAGSIKPEWIRLVRGESCGPPYDPGPYGAPLVATGAGSVWVSPAVRATSSNSSSKSIPRRIASSSGPPFRTWTPPASFLAVGAGSVWLAGDSVSEFDPVTNKLVRTIPVGGRTKTPCGIAATRDAVWVAIGDSFCDTIGL